MRNRDIIVIGASAGGVDALIQLTKHLPATLSASLFIVLHIPAQSSSYLAEVLKKYTRLRVSSPEDGEIIRHGHIYVAPSNYHMVTERGRIRLTLGPRVNYRRPAIDPLFRSAAVTYGSRVIGVILTGMLDDGTAGLALIKNRGGIAIVQNPDSAQHSAMPRSALQNVPVDHCLPLLQIAPLLVQLTMQPAPGQQAYPVTKAMKIEVKKSTDGKTSAQELNQLGAASSFTCPECHGTLWEIDGGFALRYRCRIGHAYGLDTLLVAHEESVESILWSAVRALEENAAIAHRVATRAGKRHAHTAKLFSAKAKGAEQKARKLKALLLQTKPAAT